ncbi:MAG: diadenylate cyclase [Candidatus Woesearchaeota archaeon]
MLKLKKAESNIPKGLKLLKQPSERSDSADPVVYTKNSIFGMAVDAVKRLYDQRKLVMYLSPSTEQEKRTTAQFSTTQNEMVQAQSQESEPQQKQDASLEGLQQQTAAQTSSAECLATVGSSGGEQYEIGVSSVSEDLINNKIKNIDEVIGLAATNIGKDVGANCIVSVERKPDLSGGIEDNCLDVEVVIFRKGRNNSYKKVAYRTKMKKMLQGSIIPVKELLTEAIKREYIKKGDRVVCVENESIGLGYKGMLFIFDVDNIFFNISMTHLTDIVSPDILEAVIGIAVDIGREGFEGKPIGTAFIIGDKDEIAQYTKQMIINPFQSLPDEQKKITDPSLRDTIKSFAQLDGVFIVDKNGTIVSAGTYLNVNVDKEISDALSGLGTRHRSCAAITKLTKSIAVVLSQSGGQIRIFKGGQIMMRL